MIQIHINPVRVEKILLVCGSDMEQDFDLAAWQAIRQLVDRIDRKLKKIAASATENENLDDD
jgi:hypothetical protein